MRCSFCGREFDEQAAAGACGACTLFGGCRNIKCPHCGYESPADTRLVAWLKRKFRKNHANSRD